MTKTTDFAILADQLAEIRGELAEMRKFLFQPTNGQTVREAARRDAEHPDPTPIEIPGGQMAPDTVQQLIQRYVQMEHSRLDDENLGPFEEEEDFAEDDTDHLPDSLFEINEYELEPDPDMPEVLDASKLTVSTQDAPPVDPPPAEPAPPPEPPAAPSTPT